MEWYWPFIGLASKHLIITNILDIGYSWARNTSRKHWRFALFMWIFAEVATSAAIALSLGFPFEPAILIAEVIVLTIACLIERRSVLDSVILAHLLCEFLIYSFYLYTTLLY